MPEQIFRHIYPELLYNLDTCPDNLKIHPESVDNIAVCPKTSLKFSLNW